MARIANGFARNWVLGASVVLPVLIVVLVARLSFAFGSGPGTHCLYLAKVLITEGGPCDGYTENQEFCTTCDSAGCPVFIQIANPDGASCTLQGQREGSLKFGPLNGNTPCLADDEDWQSASCYTIPG